MQHYQHILDSLWWLNLSIIYLLSILLLSGHFVVFPVGEQLSFVLPLMPDKVKLLPLFLEQLFVLRVFSLHYVGYFILFIFFFGQDGCFKSHQQILDIFDIFPINFLNGCPSVCSLQFSCCLDVIFQCLQILIQNSNHLLRWVHFSQRHLSI